MDRRVNSFTKNGALGIKQISPYPLFLKMLPHTHFLPESLYLNTDTQCQIVLLCNAHISQPFSAHIITPWSIQIIIPYSDHIILPHTTKIEKLKPHPWEHMLLGGICINPAPFKFQFLGLSHQNRDCYQAWFPVLGPTLGNGFLGQ